MYKKNNWKYMCTLGDSFSPYMYGSEKVATFEVEYLGPNLRGISGALTIFPTWGSIIWTYNLATRASAFELKMIIWEYPMATLSPREPA